MIFDSTLQNLYANDGSFIKKIDCPLAGSREHISQFQKAFENVHCSSCNKTVHCIDSLSDGQLMQMVDDNPNICVFATTAAKQLTILKKTGITRENPGLPIIHTVRGTKAIVAAQALPGQLVIKNVGRKHRFGSSEYILGRHAGTETVIGWNNRYSSPHESGDFEVIKDWYYIRDDHAQPVAAYYIPPEIQANTWVYLEDVIKDVGQDFIFHGHYARVASSKAFWDGNKMQISCTDPSSEPVLYG